MFRIKFVVGFVILIVLQTAFIVYTLDSSLIPATEDDTEISLQRSTAIIEKSHRLDEFALKEKARHVASSDRLAETMVADYEGDYDQERKNAVIPRLETEQIRFERMLEANRDERNLNLELMQRRPLDLDMFMALDDRGHLVATLGTGLKDRMGNDFGREFDVVSEVLDNDETRVDMWNWSWRAADDRELYVVSLSPIHDPEDGEPIGVVVLGTQITDGDANRRKALVAEGLEAEGADDIDDITGRDRTQAPEVTFFRGDRLYSSTLGSRRSSQLADELYARHEILEHEEPEKILETTIDGEQHRSMVRFFPGQFETNNPAGVVLTTNHDRAIAPFEAARSSILAVSGGVIALGIILFLGLLHLFVTPFGRLEEGIQEILSGDKDYEFETDHGNELANNLAHHLNLLSAFLQGKQMPDEEQSLGGWDGMDGDGADDTSSKPSSVAGVPMDLGAAGGSTTTENDDEDDDGDAADETSDASEDESTDKPRKDQPAGEPT